ncbi:hypothetical protein L228DRAFT_238176 [Xylona heveae TC161]|uniref:C2H2-type domain-containing protein n=1 Tax=Xylona heveae (strain CBS 132557 / TC161) TaxID=1328760 RepID=A0A161TCU4_XYLHT|nr:hypothetical protein L228DRAFT_238176 [Xylona heveae TC161]KZF23637.1 hypothetical protein L228DRAFT_238176 [Xylona heveae TC161]
MLAPVGSPSSTSSHETGLEEYHYTRKVSSPNSLTSHSSPPLSDQLPSTLPMLRARLRDPPRDSHGRIYCCHRDCDPNPPVFKRRCEWNKHMDKHERPYRCLDPACAKLSGFTYSGGLLRHEREVHRKHGGPRDPLMCPFRDCKRSSGAGFSRKENLKEHLRRVHCTNPIARLEDDEQQLDLLKGELMIRKRKRAAIDRNDAYTDDILSQAAELREEVKRLKLEGAEKDERLRRLEYKAANSKEKDERLRLLEDAVAALERDRRPFQPLIPRSEQIV